MSHLESPSSPRAADGRPEFLVRLGVMLPCSPEDIEQAYLEKVKHAHPDRGGTQQDFLELQTAYGRAKEYAKFQSSRRKWLGDSIERYARQQELAGEITARGGKVSVTQLDWLAGEIGEDFAQVMETIDGLKLTGSKFDDAVLGDLARRQDLLGQIHSLSLAGSRVTDAGAKHLSAFAYLRRLDLADTAVGNAALKACATLTKLEWLNVAGSRINRFGRFWLRIARPELEIAGSHRGGARGFQAHAWQLAIVVVLYIGAMAWATHMPLDANKLPRWPIPVDKVFHFTAYAGLAFLLATLAAFLWSSGQGKWWARWARYASVLPLVALYGALDELTQPAVGRTADRWDWITDVAGAAAGLALFLILRFAIKRLAQRRWTDRRMQGLAPIG